jgi:drug/metabolite transporter (DMT)-like permease
MTRPSAQYGSFALLAGVILIWGTGYWPTEVSGEHTETVLLSGLRVIGGALLLVSAALLARSRWPRGRMLGWAAISGLIMVALSHWGTTEAVARAGPGNAAVLVNAAPLIVAAVGWFVLRERLSWIGITGVIVGFGGVVLMVSSQLGGDADTRQLLIGVGLGAAAALGWAIGTLLVRAFATRRGEEMDMLSFTATQFIVAGVVLLVAGFGIDGVATTEWGSTELWAALFWIGPISGLGFAFYFVALGRMTAARASAALFLVPGVAVIVEIVRGNVPTALVLLGMLLAVAGVALVNVPRGALASVAPRVWRRLRSATTS